FLLAALFFFFQVANAQDKVTVSGYIKDSLSGETLIGATISVNGKGKGVNSNQYGFYSITLPKGTYELTVSFAGYLAQQVNLNLDSSLQFSFSLLQRSVLEEVVVYSKRRDANVNNSQMGKFDLTMAQIKSVPVIFGEVDILK
ncbi:carboxypeptidase-like regulatory domain-containing protein, partial [Stenotrophomonas maltophilia]|uniref:carboxypeptidase-like regulatory domain-containing protein n=1 Tax=Stenotrophomonas maltophilia TaxID=40324 RepID=UPI0034DB4EDA